MTQVLGEDGVAGEFRPTGRSPKLYERRGPQQAGFGEQVSVARLIRSVRHRRDDGQALVGTARLPTDVMRGEQRVAQRGWVVGPPGKFDGFVGDATRLRIQCRAQSGVAMDTSQRSEHLRAQRQDRSIQ